MAERDGNIDTKEGFLFALSAYLLWGFLPFYMKAVSHVSFLEVTAHRVVWSLPVAALVLLWLKRTDDIKRAFREPKTLAQAALTAAIISINWGVYVWAIANDRTVETALGYYINPLFSILLAAILLGEKLNRLQILAIICAAIAVVILTIESGGVPWVSFLLFVSWGFYAFFKKTLAIGPTQGFFMEILILFIPAIGYLMWIASKGELSFATSIPWCDTALLALAGIVTAVPLILYATGAKLLRLSTIGIMQYVAPTMIFLIAVFVFKEPFGTYKLIAFGFIWTALALYSWSLLRSSKA